MFSNFARLAMALGGTTRYLTFDALWCPYHVCNAGRTPYNGHTNRCPSSPSTLSSSL
jgi:hypothetical protein